MRKALRSVTIRASAACGSSRASRPVMPGPLLGLRRLERAGERAGQADRQHAVVDQAGRADRQRGLHDVMAAEDQIAQFDQPGVRERRAHGDQAGRLGEPRGDRGGARHRGRRDRPATTDKPHADPTLYVHCEPTLRHCTSVASCFSSAHRCHFMLSVKIKSVRWKAKQIIRLGLIVLLAAVLAAARGGCGRSSALQAALPGAGVHQDDGLPARLDPPGRGGDPAARPRPRLCRGYDRATPGRFTHRNLARYDVVIFLQTTGTPIRSGAQRAAFQRFIRRGGGYVGVHAASDTRGGWPWYERLVGTRFKRHDPGAVRARRRRRRPRRPPRPAACRRPGRAPTSGTSSARTRPPTCSRSSTSRVRSPGATATMAAARCTPRWVIPRSPTPSRSFVRHLLGAIEMAAGRARFACAR